MRLDIKEAIRVWKHNRKKKSYVQARQELMASYGDPSQLSVEEVADYEKRKKALYAVYFGDKK